MGRGSRTVIELNGRLRTAGCLRLGGIQIQFVGHWLADRLAGGVVGVNVPPDAQDWAVYKYSSLGTGWPRAWLVVRGECSIYLF